MQGIALPLALGVLGSLVASMIFLLIVRSFRPRLEISPQIAEWGPQENRSQVIKIINKGPRSVVDLRFELLLVTLKSVPDGILRSTKSVKLKKPEAFILYKFSTNDRDAKFARRINIDEDLNEIWNADDQQFLLFRVYAHDEVSGFAQLFEVEYRTKRNSLVEGQFHSGNTFSIS